MWQKVSFPNVNVKVNQFSFLLDRKSLFTFTTSHQTITSTQSKIVFKFYLLEYYSIWHVQVKSVTKEKPNNLTDYHTKKIQLLALNKINKNLSKQMTEIFKFL